MRVMSATNIPIYGSTGEIAPARQASTSFDSRKLCQVLVSADPACRLHGYPSPREPPFTDEVCMNLSMPGQPEVDWQALAAQLYVPLNSSPCRCQHRWEKGEITRVKECSRCVAIGAYKAVTETSP